MPVPTRRRILVQRHNLIANNQNSGAAIAANGTFPRTWGSYLPDSAKGVNIDVVTLGYERGLPFVDIRAHGTAISTPAGNSSLFFTSGTAIPMSPGEAFTLSAYARIVAGNYPSWLLFVGNELDAAQGFLRNDYVGPSFTSTLDRYFLTTTVQHASCRYVQPGLSIGYPSGVAFDVTLRLAGVQLERGRVLTPLQKRAA